jgi:endonuclease III
MKDSKKYSPKITKLFGLLKRKSGNHLMPQYADPIDAVVYALVSEHVTEPVSDRIYKRMMKHFVNLNDLRVSRREEILDVFGDSFEMADNVAASVSRVLNTIFEKKNAVNLTILNHDGKRQAHKELSEIEGITPFAVSYCFLTAMGGHAIPLNAAMLQYLRDGQLVYPGATDAEIAGFLERQIAAADAYNFYMLLRQEAEQTKPNSGTKGPEAKKKTDAKTKTAVKKKTARKK